MIDPANTPEDAALRQLYRRERPEPDARLDDAIIEAARAAIVARPPRRKWRYPVGVGAAASALLAVLILQQPSETVVELERIKASSATEPLQRPQAKSMTSMDRPEEDQAAGAASTAAALPPEPARNELAGKVAVVAPSSDAPAANRATSAAPMRVREALREDIADIADSPCEADSTRIAEDGLMLCITDESIEAHDLAMGCEPLSLSRPITGAVSVEQVEQAITISIANEPYWRVQCRNGNWQVDALR